MCVSSEDRVYCRNVQALRTDNKSIWFLNLLLSQWTGMIRVGKFSYAVVVFVIAPGDVLWTSSLLNKKGHWKIF